MAEQLTTVANVDLDRYLGTWFEICRLPLKWEDENAQDVTASYSLNEDGSIHVDNRCLDDAGEPTQSVGNAVPVDETNSRLLVSFLPGYLRWIPFTKGDYWVIRLSDDYRISLVGTPDRQHLWLLARDHDLPEKDREDYLATARAEGFDLSQLIIPKQSGRVVHIPIDEVR